MDVSHALYSHAQLHSCLLWHQPQISQSLVLFALYIHACYDVWQKFLFVLIFSNVTVITAKIAYCFLNHGRTENRNFKKDMTFYLSSHPRPLPPGHVFNMPHDNVKACEEVFGKLKDNHMMSPTLIQIDRSRPWSVCSAAIITEFLDRGHG